jgi:uncharacterized protein YjdB
MSLLKKVLIILFLIISSLASAKTFYVSITGNDNNPGTLTQPWLTWHYAFNHTPASDTCYFRGGVYPPISSTRGASLGSQVSNGTRTHPTCFFNYPGEVPELDCITIASAPNQAGIILFDCDNLYFKGLVIKNVRQLPGGLPASGWLITNMSNAHNYAPNNIKFENCTAHHIGGRGFCAAGVDTIYYINCDGYNLCDSLTGYDGGGGSAAFSVQDANYLDGTRTYVYYYGCRAWRCADQGFSHYVRGRVIYDHCWAINNGNMPFPNNVATKGSGFKWAWYNDAALKNPNVVQVTIVNCIAAHNEYRGFNAADDYGTKYEIRAHLYNNFSYNNGKNVGKSSWLGNGFYDRNNVDTIGQWDHKYANNLSYSNRENDDIIGAYHQLTNFWQPNGTVTIADFASLDTTGMCGPRQADGSLPVTNFGRLASTSNLIDAGTNVGISYNGSAPDIGAFEYLITNPSFIPVTSITVTGAGGAIAITADNGALQLNAAVLPANATNKTVAWSLSSGADKASISSTGIVTAINNGTVTARATANDGSGVYGTLIITISNQVIPITNITVTGAGGATAITADNGTLQLNAAVLPANATNKAVTWSLTNGTGQATINSTGLVTAAANGTVTAKATANDGSGVYGTLIITISNQVFPVTNITVTGAGGATAITTDNGTLQLNAAVLPANATNKAVTWSLTNGTGQATINSTGLVTAAANGTVTAKATANDGSGVYGTMIITISNQGNESIANTPPVIVVDYKSSSYSGFIGEINASGSYDTNNDNLTYTWSAPDNIPISSTSGSKIKYLGPIVNSPQTYNFTLRISDGKTTQSKTIAVEILPYKPELEVVEISNIEASNFQAPYYPYNAIDGNIGTMWSAEGDNQWLLIELKQSFNVQHVKIAFQPGQKRESYFDILGSKDGVNWKPILIKSESCGFSGDLQVFDFPPSKTGIEINYVKLVGRCNSTDTWNYISELKIFGSRYLDPPEYENLLVKIYPNPARESITLRIDEANIHADLIQINNLSGEVILKKENDPDLKEFTIPLDLKNGIYIIQLISGKLTQFTQKLIVSR